MPYITYTPKNFGADAQQVIAQAEAIATQYAAQGYDLTLRQLYYQFVARDLIPNTDRSYKRLGGIINDARLAGMLDWDHIVDRTREHDENSHWDSPSQIVRAVARQYLVDKWEGQDTHVEVWVEKEALAGVVERAARAVDVGWFSCRGYVSQSAMWQAAQRFKPYLEDDKKVVIVHLGDHDPSGIDMTRDIEDRIRLFVGEDVGYWAAEDYFEVRRIALNRDQIDQYNPPPNPAKLTDARAQGYIAAHGYQSWELDALEPQVLADLITAEVLEHRDEELFAERAREEAEHRELLGLASRHWDDVATFLRERSA